MIPMLLAERSLSTIEAGRGHGSREKARDSFVMSELPPRWNPSSRQLDVVSRSCAGTKRERDGRQNRRYASADCTYPANVIFAL